MYPQGPAAYDSAITLFSPDGRLFQVEYAREAVKRGATALGIRYDTGVLLAVDKNVSSSLMIAESIRKIHQIDKHIWVASSGLAGDAQNLINTGRLLAQRNRLDYGEPITVHMLTRKLSDILQSYTQYAGARPYGATLLVAGVDKEPKLFDTDPSGTFIEYTATSVGVGKTDVEKILEEKASSKLNKPDAIELALDCIGKVAEGKPEPRNIDVITIDQDKGYSKLSEQEIIKSLY